MTDAAPSKSSRSISHSRSLPTHCASPMTFASASVRYCQVRPVYCCVRVSNS